MSATDGHQLAALVLLRVLIRLLLVKAFLDLVTAVLTLAQPLTVLEILAVTAHK